MNILKIVKGKIEVRRETGALIRTIGNDVVTADFNSDQSLIVITTIKGKVEIRRDTGAMIRTIGPGDAISARWVGKDIAINTSKGKTELRRENGAFIRNI